MIIITVYNGRNMKIMMIYGVGVGGNARDVPELSEVYISCWVSASRIAVAPSSSSTVTRRSSQDGAPPCQLLGKRTR
jgi:hypothetical protein